MTTQCLTKCLPQNPAVPQNADKSLGILYVACKQEKNYGLHFYFAYSINSKTEVGFSEIFHSAKMFHRRECLKGTALTYPQTQIYDIKTQYHSKKCTSKLLTGITNYLNFCYKSLNCCVSLNNVLKSLISRPRYTAHTYHTPHTQSQADQLECNHGLKIQNIYITLCYYVCVAKR
jgi:hypothetical protein